MDAANVSLPSLFECQRSKAKQDLSPTRCGPTGQICFAEHHPVQTGLSSLRDEPKQQKPSVSENAM
jgi:hypothetical protein